MYRRRFRQFNKMVELNEVFRQLRHFLTKELLFENVFFQLTLLKTHDIIIKLTAKHSKKAVTNLDN